jgi:hypothetical protein
MGVEVAVMSSDSKKSSMSFPPDFRLPGLDAKQNARKAGATAAVSAPNSAYYRQGVLVPGGAPPRSVSRNRSR